ncbi:MAG: TRAP transporter small permease subunit [Nitrospiraceae bacterium]|nr:TRAP transporter small permease subunit [Nitrospiraceae bacterium]
MIEKIVRTIDRLSFLGAYLSAVLLVIIVLLIVINVILMSFFNSSIMITDEYSAYMFAAFVMLSLSFTLKENAHIKITVISSKLPKEISKILKIITTLLAFFMSVFALYYSIFMVWQAYVYQMRADTVAQTLIYIPQIFMPIGFLMLSLQLVSEFLKEFK